MQNNREYKINIDPRILELLGPSLYTNIYYVLAELIANSYDANASNVYIIQKDDKIIVEDDGTGMSYSDGDIEKYLNVAKETRNTKEESFVSGTSRKRMGRKGVGKLAALSVSERVLIMTKKNEEKSGFVLSRYVDKDHKLEALKDDQIIFEKINENGTSVVMTKPQYGLHKTASAIKNNMLKIFPLVSPDFKIHIASEDSEITIDSFDKEMIEGLGALIILGEQYNHLASHFDSGLERNNEIVVDLLKTREEISLPIMMNNKQGAENQYDIKIKGWLGAYKSTRGRKNDRDDFPDNFISLLSNEKLGEYNIIPAVGKNKLQEVYVVGQLHIDLFEETELPDIALSNRQGYKADDPRYKKVISHIRDNLLPEIVNMRMKFAGHKKDEAEKGKIENQKKGEEELKRKVDKYKNTASQNAAKKISESQDQSSEKMRSIIEKELNSVLPIVGIKQKIDSQKKKILISHTNEDKVLADVIHKMLVFNNITDKDIIYTSSDNEDCRIPEGVKVFEYLRDFFVNSYSEEKIFVIYVTSKNMSKNWFAVTEVGAGWITKSNHKVFNVSGHKPEKPLDTDVEWHESSIDDQKNISMVSKEFDKFIVKITDICNALGIQGKNKQLNEKELKRHANLIDS